MPLRRPSICLGLVTVPPERSQKLWLNCAQAGLQNELSKITSGSKQSNSYFCNNSNAGSSSSQSGKVQHPPGTCFMYHNTGGKLPRVVANSPTHVISQIVEECTLSTTAPSLRPQMELLGVSRLPLNPTITPPQETSPLLTPAKHHRLDTLLIG